MSGKSFTVQLRRREQIVKEISTSQINYSRKNTSGQSCILKNGADEGFSKEKISSKKISKNIHKKISQRLIFFLLKMLLYSLTSAVYPK